MKNNTKVPNPYAPGDQANYFEQTGDGGIRCIGAAWTADPQTHVVICAPDIIILKRFWSKITTQPLDVKKAPILLYKYEPDKPEFKAPIEGKNLGNVMKMKDRRIKSAYMWFFNDEKNSCFINFEGDSPKNMEIGPAIKMTIIECKLLLRGSGWNRRDIDKLNIDPTDPIPF